MYVADRRLYLTEDKKRVVEEGDPAAYYLYATPGAHIPVAEARELGLVADDSPDAPASEAPQRADESGGSAPTADAGAADADGTDAKAAKPMTNKARAQQENKALGADMQAKER